MSWVDFLGSLFPFISFWGEAKSRMLVLVCVSKRLKNKRTLWTQGFKYYFKECPCHTATVLLGFGWLFVLSRKGRILRTKWWRIVNVSRAVETLFLLMIWNYEVSSHHFGWIHLHVCSVCSGKLAFLHGWGGPFPECSTGGKGGFKYSKGQEWGNRFASPKMGICLEK